MELLWASHSHISRLSKQYTFTSARDWGCSVAEICDESYTQHRWSYDLMALYKSTTIIIIIIIVIIIIIFLLPSLPIYYPLLLFIICYFYYLLLLFSNTSSSAYKKEISVLCRDTAPLPHI